ncbi:MAG TPA: FixH family protein [Vicinamibacterales bacterium]|nr:FixH family protein [Vicinamibacterales bacterium]
MVGPAALTVTLRHPSRDPVRGATVRLEGHMSHAGMAPVLADATESAPGVYDLRFAFTMQGDWVLLVSAALPDGARVERRIDVARVRPPG